MKKIIIKNRKGQKIIKVWIQNKMRRVILEEEGKCRQAENTKKKKKKTIKLV